MKKLAASCRHRLGLRVGALALLGACATSALASPARAVCAAPEVAILWSYPDATTASVPPNAVLWAVADSTVELSVALDGVPLEARGSGRVETHQFVPEQPLSRGEHELVMRAARVDVPGMAPRTAERRVVFQVVEEPPVEAEVSVSSVTVYPEDYPEEAIYESPDGDTDPACQAPAVPLTPRCYDTGPYRVTRIGYEARGDALAYLAQGDTLVRAGCTSYWVPGDADIDPAFFRVAPVLPTGVGNEQTFPGPLEVLGGGAANPDASSGGCSFGGGSAGASDRGAVAPLGSALIGIVGIVGAARRRRAAARAR